MTTEFEDQLGKFERIIALDAVPRLGKIDDPCAGTPLHQLADILVDYDGLRLETPCETERGP